MHVLSVGVGAPHSVQSRASPRKIVEKSGGTLRVESRLGHGSSSEGLLPKLQNGKKRNRFESLALSSTRILQSAQTVLRGVSFLSSQVANTRTKITARYGYAVVTNGKERENLDFSSVAATFEKAIT